MCLLCYCKIMSQRCWAVTSSVRSVVLTLLGVISSVWGFVPTRLGVVFSVWGADLTLLRLSNFWPQRADGVATQPVCRSESTQNVTLASRVTTAVPAEGETSVIPLANAPPTTLQGLDPSLVQSLLPTVTAEVTRQLTATLPALASLSGPTTPSPMGDVFEPAEERRPSTPPLPGVSATNLVDGAIDAAHSRITGAPQLLPTSVQPQRLANPSQIFLSASLPIDSQHSTKIKEKIWNEEFVDFGSLWRNSVHDKYQISVQNTETGAPASFCL